LSRLVEVVLIAEKDDLVLQPGGADRVDRLDVEVCRQADAADFCADAPTDRHDVERTRHRADDLLSRTHGLLLP
jgi:hypothetical protein